MSSLSITEHFTVLRCGHHHIILLCFIIHIYRSLIIPLCYCVCIPGTLQGAIVTFRFENYEAAWTRSIISPFFLTIKPCWYSYQSIIRHSSTTSSSYAFTFINFSHHHTLSIIMSSWEFLSAFCSPKINPVNTACHLQQRVSLLHHHCHTQSVKHLTV